jgi:hypothetical protein
LSGVRRDRQARPFGRTTALSLERSVESLRDVGLQAIAAIGILELL